MDARLIIAAVLIVFVILPLAIWLRLRLLDREAEEDRAKLPRFGTCGGHPVEYIGPAGFPDCRRESCMNTAPHVPGERCIG